MSTSRMAIDLRKTTKQVSQSFVDDSSTNNSYIPKLANITLWCLDNEDKQRFINSSILEDLKAKSLADKLDHARATTICRSKKQRPLLAKANKGSPFFDKAHFKYGSVSWWQPSYHRRGRRNWWGFHQGIHDVSHAVQESTTWECSLTVRSVNHIKGAAAMLRKMRRMILVIRAKAGELGCWPDGLK